MFRCKSGLLVVFILVIVQMATGIVIVCLKAPKSSGMLLHGDKYEHSSAASG